MVFYGKMGGMKRLLLFFFAFAFAFNALSLSAFAAACPHGSAYEAQKASPSVMPCHEAGQKKQDHSQKTDQKPGHCEGICLCLHAALGPIATLTRTSAHFENHALMKSTILPAGPDVFVTHLTVPLDRPPKNLS